MSAGDSVPARADLPNAAKLAALGMISGAISWALIDASDHSGLKFDLEGFGVILMPISVYPGLAFGLLVGAFFRYRGRITWLRAIGYVLAAGLGYLAAFHACFYILTGVLNDQNGAVPYVASGVPAGLAGSLLLGLLTRFLLPAPARLVLRFPVAVGTAAGALLALGGLYDSWGFLAFFVLWQGTRSSGAKLAP